MLTSRGMCMALILVNQSILAKFLGPAGRGEYALCMMFATLVYVGLLFGMDWSISYFVSTGRISRNQALTVSLLATMLVLAVGVAAGSLAIRVPLVFFSKAPREAFQMAVFWIPSLAMFVCLTGALRGMREFRFLSLLLPLRWLAVIGGTVITIKVLDWGVVGPITAEIGATAILTVVVLVWGRRKHAFRLQLPSWKIIREMVHYGMRILVGSFGMLVNARIGTLLLGFFATREQIGQFAVAMGILAVIISVSDVTGHVIQPRVARDERGRPELVALCNRGLMLLSATAVVVLLLLAKPLFAVVFTKDFYPAIPLLWILAPAVVVRCASKCIIPYFNGTNRPGIGSLATLVNLAVNLGLLVVLLPWLGVPGAAWAASVSYIACAAVLVYCFVRNSGLGLSEAFLPRLGDWRSMRSYLRGKPAPQGGQPGPERQADA